MVLFPCAHSLTLCLPELRSWRLTQIGVCRRWEEHVWIWQFSLYMWTCIPTLKNSTSHWSHKAPRSLFHFFLNFSSHHVNCFYVGVYRKSVHSWSSRVTDLLLWETIFQLLFFFFFFIKWPGQVQICKCFQYK